MKWIRLQERRLLPLRDVGMASQATLAMIAASFNVTETFVLTGIAYRHALAGAKTLADARRALEKYDFSADAPSFTRLVESIGPDIMERCSPVVPRAWSWFDPATFDTAEIFRGLAELQDGIRESWLQLLDIQTIQRARDAGVTEAEYLSTASMAVLVQRAELHPGLSGRAWSPNASLGELNAMVQCTLGAGDGEAAAWEWTVSTTGEVLRRPTPSPADERPIIQSARLAVLLGDRTAMPCTLNWIWDGQELTFLSALPAPAHVGARTFSRRSLARLIPRPLGPMASDIVVELLHDLLQGTGALLLGNRTPPVPPDVARVFDGFVYIDLTFARYLLDHTGLPPGALDDVLLQQTTASIRLPAKSLIRLPRASRAAVAVRLAVPRLQRWISDNSTRLTELDGAHVETLTGDETQANLQQLLTFMRPLVLNLLLLLVSSSFRADDLKRALAHRGIQDRFVEALQAASDTAGLDPWTHLDRIAARVSDDTARLAAEAIAKGDSEQALRTLCTDVTVERDLEAFMRAFSFFRTSIVDVGSPTLQERSDLLPVALLRARETGAATRVEAARDPLAWLDSLPGGGDARLRKRYQAMIRTSAVTEKAWFYVAKSLSRARMLLLHAGNLLVERGRLDRRDDVLLLKREELAQDGDLRAIVAERAALVQSNMAATAPKVIIVE
ncbi:hypothetical protein [Candidatus Cryosericum septentrionale]|jgi:hypothetical protein|uniref:Phosphoenolpyruvate synthase n=1 Tax=Candidatus Cryosericum septentrionale TaxID=2290913 RepID=A0A398DRK5_9BACT|nr:hypothetical protein [Candidatus Cryosericum septentrionale]RIE17550.1 hypothetical protein SMC1_01105 [Candidatus Cryosericum septentrionale]